jgi:hypothetical protein
MDDRGIRWTGRGRTVLDAAVETADDHRIYTGAITESWLKWAIEQYGAVLPTPVARRLALTGEAPGDKVTRLDALRMAAAVRRQGMPDYPDSPEDVADTLRLVTALEPLQAEVIAAADGATGA